MTEKYFNTPGYLKVQKKCDELTDRQSDQGGWLHELLYATKNVLIHKTFKISTEIYDIILFLELNLITWFNNDWNMNYKYNVSVCIQSYGVTYNQPTFSEEKNRKRRRDGNVVYSTIHADVIENLLYTI